MHEVFVSSKNVPTWHVLQFTGWSIIYNEICDKEQMLEIITFQIYFKDCWFETMIRQGYIVKNVFFTTIYLFKWWETKEGSSSHQLYHIKNLIQIWIVDWLHRKGDTVFLKHGYYSKVRSNHFTKLKITSACCQNFFQ